MGYLKPEVVNCDAALVLVAGNNKGSTHLDGVQPFPYNETVNAYESDE
jgi:hypothetical protein